MAGGANAMAQVIPACAWPRWARIRDQPSFEAGGGRQSARSEFLSPTFSYNATFAGMALFAAVSGVCCLTGSIFMLEAYDWVMPGGSVETFVGAAILDLVLLRIRERHHSQSPSRSNRQATERSGERAGLPESSYELIAEKNIGRAFTDTFIWRCAVHQRAGPGGDSRELDRQA
jgi:hypothetical protein